MKIRGIEYDEDITLKQLIQDLQRRGEFEEFAELLKHNQEIKDEPTAQELLEEINEQNS